MKSQPTPIPMWVLYALTFPVALVSVAAFLYVGVRTLEPHVFDVVSDFQVTRETSTPEGLEIRVSFVKDANCEFVSLAWFDKDGYRVPVTYPPAYDAGSYSRPIGYQRAGPWLLNRLQSLEGTRAVAAHRCHPFWLTYTNLYP